jgi:hypothetical protein
MRVSSSETGSYPGIGLIHVSLCLVPDERIAMEVDVGVRAQLARIRA